MYILGSYQFCGVFFGKKVLLKKRNLLDMMKATLKKGKNQKEPYKKIENIFAWLLGTSIILALASAEGSSACLGGHAKPNNDSKKQVLRKKRNEIEKKVKNEKIGEKKKRVKKNGIKIKDFPTSSLFSPGAKTTSQPNRGEALTSVSFCVVLLQEQEASSPQRQGGGGQHPEPRGEQPGGT